ncbi:hypothetical protein NMY22_g7321 [Coprinellus aureogranulatus]|nr:hypothetical protein NMY22_g7321 [Coprinellus aureogranulatus]
MPSSKSTAKKPYAKPANGSLEKTIKAPSKSKTSSRSGKRKSEKIYEDPHLYVVDGHSVYQKPTDEKAKRSAEDLSSDLHAMKIWARCILEIYCPKWASAKITRTDEQGQNAHQTDVSVFNLDKIVVVTSAPSIDENGNMFWEYAGSGQTHSIPHSDEMDGLEVNKGIRPRIIRKGEHNTEVTTKNVVGLMYWVMKQVEGLNDRRGKWTTIEEVNLIADWFWSRTCSESTWELHDYDDDADNILRDHRTRVYVPTYRVVQANDSSEPASSV